MVVFATWHNGETLTGKFMKATMENVGCSYGPAVIARLCTAFGLGPVSKMPFSPPLVNGSPAVRPA